MSVYQTVVSWLSGTPAKLDRSGEQFLAGTGPTFARRSVTPDTTLQLSTAWACVRLNARTIGSLPLKLYERGSTMNRTLAEGHPLYRVLAETPNDDQGAMEFWEGQITALNLRGNAYARIGRRGDGQVVSLWPLSPDRVTVFRSADGARRYRVTTLTKTEELEGSDIFHLRGFGAGGDMGLSPIGFGRQTISTALAAEEVAGSTFANGLQLAGFVELATGTKLLPEQRQQLVELFERFAGSGQAGKVMPLDPGMKFTPLKMTAQDAQLLESRRFSVEELCRWFGVFPVLIGHAAQGQTMWGSGIEQLVLAWLTLGLGPELIRIEEAISQQLLNAIDRRRYYAEHIVEGLLRADSAGRAALYSALGQNGVMYRNEMRAKENLPADASPAANKLTVQSNLVTLDQLDELGSGNTGDQVRSSLINLLFGGDVDAAIDARLKTMLDQAIAGGGPRCNED